MKLTFKYNEKWRCVMLKSPILAGGQKWRHWLNTISVYRLILTFLMTKNTVLHHNCSSI